MYALTHPRSATPVTATFAVVIALVVLTVLSEPWLLEAGVALALGLACMAAASDARTGRIPDRLVLLASLPIGIVMCAAMVNGPTGAVRGAAIGMAAMAGPLLVVHVTSPRAMGFGDVKLAAVLGAAIGLVDPRAAVLALCAASAATALVAFGRRRAAMPFGPGLVLGAALALVSFDPAAGGLIPWR
jgi:leader peptidase (prepilin peptidase)/N-methyltransferase